MNAIKVKATIILSLIAMGLLFIAPGYAEIDPKSIVGAWLFDEGQGNTAKDSSGKGERNSEFGIWNSELPHAQPPTPYSPSPLIPLTKGGRGLWGD
jgi:hypothetical protein